MSTLGAVLGFLAALCRGLLAYLGWQTQHSKDSAVQVAESNAKLIDEAFRNPSSPAVGVPDAPAQRDPGTAGASRVSGNEGRGSQSV